MGCGIRDAGQSWAARRPGTCHRSHDRAGALACSRRKRGNQNQEALSRSRGGFSTKIHIRTNAKGDPLTFDVTTAYRWTSAKSPGIYQYTAIDNCSRYKALGVYPRRNLSFLERVVEEMPFPIQRIQTDRGLEFFAEAVQRRLMESAIKFCPVPPRSPHLNGKVERTQRSDLEDSWATVDPKATDIEDRLAEWQHFWNWDRLHMALGGNTPIDHICERSRQDAFS